MGSPTHSLHPTPLQEESWQDEKSFAAKERIMFEVVVTNGMSIVIVAVMWSVLTWLATYAYMGRKVQELQYTIHFLDEYIVLNEEKYGYVIDDHINHYKEGWDD